MTSITILSIEQIDTSDRIRPPDPAQVEAIRNSILGVGLLNPISVNSTGERYRLVAGLHRLEAYKRLGYDEIPAIVFDLSELEAILAECDENLCGTKLTPSDEAKFMARRKDAYEALYPETKHGATLENPQVARSATREAVPRFITDTAEKTGISERSVSKHAERGKKIVSEALDLVRGTPLDKGVYLDKLKALPPDQQVGIVRRDLENPPAPKRPYAHLSGALVSQGGIAGRYQSAPESKPDPVKTAEKFVTLVDQIEALSVYDLVSSGRMRAQVGQRASGLADHMTEIMERLNQ